MKKEMSLFVNEMLKQHTIATCLTIVRNKQQLTVWVNGNDVLRIFVKCRTLQPSACVEVGFPSTFHTYLVLYNESNSSFI